MPALIVMFILQLVRLIFDDRSNPATDPAAINRQAEEFASSGNYAMAEKNLLALVKMAERQDGRDGMAVAIYLRRLAQLKVEQGDNVAAESLLQRKNRLRNLIFGEGVSSFFVKRAHACRHDGIARHRER